MNKNNIHGLEVGQILYTPQFGERQINYIGREYFTLTGDYQKQKYSLKTLWYTDKERHQHNKRLYLTKQEIIDAQLRREIQLRLRNNDWDYSLDDLQKIEASITEMDKGKQSD